ncbi:MAG: hypothetical protein GEU96_03705 [Propionibacteriales bacterium]|nr:hypothetical protein [Propionibacteriales bacterium]
MDLGIQRQTIVRVAFDNAITVFIEGHSVLTIETELIVEQPDAGTVSVDPGKLDAAVKSVTDLLHREIAAADADESGSLIIALDDGSGIRVMPHASFEAWSMVGPGDRRIVCKPGGGLSVWSPTSE